MGGFVKRGRQKPPPVGAGDPRQQHYRHLEDARRVLNELAAVGIDYDDVMQTLEDHGVTAFDASWDRMAAPLREALIR